ncbi:MAG: transcriptional regulator NrdR [Clostridiales bacterium]|nr:transcriptional regulator NrdR [Clostridiales bacterium]
MKCPFCGMDNTRVIDSRPADDNASIRRRRQCDECGKRFTTYEKVEIIPLTVIKKDRTREPYDRSKIMAGVLRACHKRPIPVEKIEETVNKIENDIFNLEYKEIESKVIGEIVMERLKSLEQVAYVRFASVYREFKDVNTFMNELKKMLDSSSDPQEEKDSSNQ